MHVLLALDGSREAMAAASLLSRLPFVEKPKLTVVTALTDSPYDLVTTDRSDWLRETEQTHADKHFEQVRELLEPKFSQIEFLMEQEHPNKLITEAARQRDVDLVVLGARGHSAVYRVMLGSTAAYVANHAQCSVLVVRAFDDGSFADLEPPYRVLVAYDGSDMSREACRQMCWIQWPQEAEVHVAMVLERPKLLPDDVIYDPPQIQASQKSLEELELICGLNCQVKRSVHEAVHVGTSIRVTAEEERVHMLFMGGTGKSAIARFFLGSASHYVLNHAHCPMWIAREKHWK
ncbi:MAG: universal stress protein [bacterium]|nr:universal stress protein [bacterium]